MANRSLQSYNSRVKNSLRLFLQPGGADIALYLFLAMMLLLGLNAKNIWDYFSSQNLVSQNLGQLISQNEPWIPTFLKKLSEGRLLQGVFWAVLGTFIYILVWSLRNLTVNIRNDIVADEYIHPAEYKRFLYWRSIIARKVTFVVATVVWVAFIISSVQLISSLANLCRQAVSNSNWMSSVMQLLGCWIVVSILIYLFMLLSRIVMIGWRLIYTDL